MNWQDIRYMAKYPRLFFSPVRYLFIFSHMRSRSSVLAHILGSHPEICGYRELHLSYLNRWDLLEMRRRILADLDCGTDLSGRYLLDKILHDKHRLSKKILDRARLILLIREPESSFKSTALIGQKFNIDWYQDAKQWLNYYQNRLNYLLHIAAQKDYFLIESDQWLADPETVLNQLSQWLELNTPLQKTYRLFRYTGQPGHGDPSEHILSGRLESKKKEPGPCLPEPILNQARAIYQHCYDRLRS